MNIYLSRRNFLASAAAFSLAGCASDKFGFLSGTPRLRFGVISDIHITDWDSTKIFIKTLRYFDQQGVDAVLIAGDLADHGIIQQLENVGKAWETVFPNDQGHDGRKVEKLFVTGNHDPEGLAYRDAFMDGQLARHGLTHEQAQEFLLTKIGWPKAWDRCFHEEYVPIYHKQVKGYDFIGGHWESWTGIDGLEDWFKANIAKINTTQPFFYFQHPHPENTVYGPWAWGHDRGQSTRALSPYLNAVAFSGHSHTTLTDEKSIWRGEFTSIGTSSLSYTCLNGGFRENHRELYTKTRFGLNTDDSIRQGQICTVYEDRLVLQRRDFVRDEDIDTAWVLEMPTKASPFAARAAKSTAPEFPAGAVIKLDFEQHKDPQGQDISEAVLRFPAATATKGRVNDYEITIIGKDQDVEEKISWQQRFYSPHAALPRSTDAQPYEVELRFPKAKCWWSSQMRIEIAPYNSLGRHGKKIDSGWLAV